MDNTQVLCDVCSKECRLRLGQIGFCRARANIEGTVKSINYGQATSLALDPIEKKPLKKFFPGSYILSYGSYGCDFRCPFCQNFTISMAGYQQVRCQTATPRALCELAVKLSGEPKGNLGVAFTYNEPLISYEFVRDCSILLHEVGLKSVAITNGSLSPKYADIVLPHLDALNIDLKGFTEKFYRYVKGDFQTVKGFIKNAFSKGCHIELTTLIIPTKNDDLEIFEQQAKWIAGISSDIPWHLSRFFPRYKQNDLPITSTDTLFHLQEIASRYLKFVYVGNI